MGRTWVGYLMRRERRRFESYRPDLPGCGAVVSTLNLQSINICLHKRFPWVGGGALSLAMNMLLHQLIYGAKERERDGGSWLSH